MKKTTTEKAIVAANILANAKIDKMEAKEKFAIIRALRHLRPVAEDYQKFLEDASKRLRPEEIEDIAKKPEAELTAEERDIVSKYNADVAECVKTELAKELELDYEPLAEEAFARFAESNPEMPLASVVALMDALADNV